MDAARRESRPFWRKLLLLSLTVSFERLPGNNVSATPSCGTSQHDGEHALSCSNRDNTPSSSRSDVDKKKDYATSITNRIKRRVVPSAPLKDWRADRFAFEDGRAGEFEAIRVDEYPWDLPISRRRISEITPASFREDFEEKSRPVIVSGIPEEMGWPAWQRWTWEGLGTNYSELEVKTASDNNYDGIKIKMGDFLRYARIQMDDTPLYAFDPEFALPNGKYRMDREYSVPHLFPEDLLSCMGEERRPPYRWLLVGPKRSGLGIHIDPGGTSAWNTLLHGRKLWVMSAPGTLETMKGSTTGVGRDAEIEAFGDKARRHDQPAAYKTLSFFLGMVPSAIEKLSKSKQMYIVVQHPGETMFVPSGWVHGVLNLDDTVAVTQNFISSANFDQAWRVLRSSRAKFAVLWLHVLRSSRPDLVFHAIRLNDLDEFDVSKAVLNDNDTSIELEGVGDGATADDDGDDDVDDSDNSRLAKKDHQR